jgi:transcriptional regulator with XRE-family HTH domain
MDFAEALRALMDERGISGNSLARRVPCDKALISRFVNGHQQPSAKLAQQLDDVLDADEGLAALAQLRRPRKSPARASSEADTAIVPCQTPDGRIIFVDVQRRLFLQGAAAAAFTAAVPAGSGPELNGEPVAARFAIARRVLRDSDNLFGPTR